MEESLANALHWSHLCEAFEQCKHIPKKEDRLSFLFSKNLKRIVNTKQSAYPLIRLILPQLDTERKRYQIKNQTWIKLYVSQLGISSKGKAAQRLNHWRNPDKLKALGGGRGYATFAGDFPAVVEAVLLQSAPKTSTRASLGDINERLDQLHRAKSKDEKAKVVMWMLRNLSAMEQKWLIRVVLKEMKIGLKHESVLKYLGKHALEHYNTGAGLRKVIESLHDRSVGRPKISIGSAFAPMLAKRYANFTVASAMGIDKVFGIEPKMDGERMLVHKDGDCVQFFTRNMNDYTKRYGPSVAKFVRKAVRLEKCILDGEMMSWDNANRAFVPFGHNRTVALETDARNGHRRVRREEDEAESPSKRKRTRRTQGRRRRSEEGKKEAEEKEDDASMRWLCYLVFDIVHDGDRSISHWPLSKRRKFLEKSLRPISKHIEILPMKTVGLGTRESRHSETMCVFDDMLREGHEGIILKDLESTYDLGEKSRQLGRWVKLKPDYVDCLSETLDLVVLGGYYSKSKRSGGVLNTFLLGLPEPDTSDTDFRDTKFYTVCKAGSGMKQEMMNYLTKRLKGRLNSYDPDRPPKHFVPGWRPKPDNVPHVWIEPCESIVVEIRGSEIAESKDFTSKWTVRFPRIVRIREDKKWWNGTSLEQFLSFVKNRNGCMIDEKRSVRDLSIEDVKGIARAAKRRKRRVGGSGGSSSASQKRSKGGVLEDFRLTDTSNVKIDRDIFRNEEIMVFPPHHRDRLDDPVRHSMASLHRVIKACNGRVVMNVLPTTSRIVAYSSKHFKVDNYVKGATKDVLSYKWLLRCVSTGRIVTPYPNEFIHQTAATKARMGKLVDAYGDSYADEVDRTQLERILKSMDAYAVVKKAGSGRCRGGEEEEEEEREDGNVAASSAATAAHDEIAPRCVGPEEMSEIQGELRSVLDCPLRMFSGCVVYGVCSSSSSSSEPSSSSPTGNEEGEAVDQMSIRLDLLMERMRLYGAEISANLDARVTHVVVQETEDFPLHRKDATCLRDRIRELTTAAASPSSSSAAADVFALPIQKRVVRDKWALACIRRGTYIDPTEGDFERPLSDGRRMYL